MSRAYQPKDASPSGLLTSQQALWRKLQGSVRLAKLPDGASADEVRRRLNDVISFLQSIGQTGDWTNSE